MNKTAIKNFSIWGAAEADRGRGLSGRIDGDYAGGDCRGAAAVYLDDGVL